ncbi:MAG: hypothetical protein Q8916_02450 [Bacteroidota bacterium]|nr:hypothetical protein [Bacteroidota bacterium]MDP4229247.1 hypothetical protein [Bacteroidota bacterium]MDP4235537.1 hypothetical protein [Bacteroidota bacterium]
MKNILIAMTIAAAVLTSAASAQTYAPKYGQKLVLSGSGNDIANTLTLQTPILGSGGYTLTFPGTSTNGPLFNKAGTLSWATQSAMLSFLGLTGSSGSNTGDVTLAGPGSYLSLTGQQINQALITYGNIQNVGANKILGNNTASPASVTELTASDVKTFLNLTGTNSGDVTLAGQNYLSIAGQVITASPVNLSGGNVSGQLPYGGIQNETNNTLLGNTSGIAAPPSEQSPAAIKTLLNLTGTNSGDVTVAGPGTYLTLTGQQINQALITYANMQNVSATSRLLGRASAGAGSVEEITIGSGLTLTGTTLSASGSGTITGSGSINSIPVWTSSSALGNSSITDASGTVSTNENLTLSGVNNILTLTGNGAGVSSFTTGAQGATNLNYTLPTTLPTTNQVLTATSVAGSAITLGWSSAGAVTFARKTTDVVLTASNTTLQSDADLFIPMVANATYEFSGVIAYDGSTTSSDLKIAFTIPAGASIRWSFDQAGTAITPSSITSSGTAASTFHVDATTSTNDQSIFVSGIVVVGGTAGNLQLQEAQATSQAATTTILTNSHLKATRVQ